MSHPLLTCHHLVARTPWYVIFRALGLVLLVSSLSLQSAWADFGIFQDYAIINANNAGFQYYAGGSNADRASNSFQGQNFGVFMMGQTLLLGSEVKTFKNNGTNVTGGRLYYRVYLTTATPSSDKFIQTNPAFSDNLNNGNGDQKWTNVNNSQGNNTSAPVDLLDGLAAGDYTLEVYWTAQADFSADAVENNSGANYKATFSYTAAPMPVELTAFTAQRQGTEAVLSWATATETNNAGFEVQVSTDGQTFRTLSMVMPATATSQTAHSYTYLDREDGAAGLRYYRLRQVDLDGTSTYSPVRMVQFDMLATVQLAAVPNPFQGDLTLRLELVQASGGPAVLTLTDAMGRAVLHQTLEPLPAGLSQTTLPETSLLPAGVYVARLVLPAGTQVTKVVKQ